MKSTNLRSYSVVLLALTGTLSLACGSSGGSTDGAGGKSGGGGDESGGKTSSGGSGGSSGSSGFDAGTDPNRNKVSPGGICERVAEIQCAGEAFCCAMPMETVAACITTQKMACSVTLALDTAAMDPVTGFDMTKASAALEKFETLASTCDTTISAFGISLDGFRGIVAGTVAANGTCNPSSTETNKVAASAAALVSCTDPAATSCLPAPSGTDWKCTARADAGGHCFSDANCKDGMYCDNPSLSPTGGPCVMRKATGADCMQGNECASLGCVGDKCVDQTKDVAYCLKTGS